jgi:DNA-binding GntR family transcriptional regulator
MLRPAAIIRRSLHDELVERLRDMVTDGELKPGDKVPEQALCDRFGVSRTPLREALKVLASEGLMQITPGRGTRVAALSESEIDELFPVLGALEGLAGSLAVERMTPGDLAELRALHDQMMGHFRQRRQAPYLRLNRAIHEKIFAIAGNAALFELYRQLLVRVHSLRFVVKKTAAQWSRAVKDHERVMAAFTARDGERVAAILRDHLSDTAANIARSSIAPAEEPIRPQRKGGRAAT